MKFHAHYLTSQLLLVLAGVWLVVGMLELAALIVGADTWVHSMKSFLVAWLFHRLSDLRHAEEPTR